MKKKSDKKSLHVMKRISNKKEEVGNCHEMTFSFKGPLDCDLH